EASVDAIDISADAIAVAEQNIKTHELDERVHAIQSDLYKGVQGQQYDLIIANPPYVSKAEVASLPAEYTHEPVLGLEAGADGLEVVRRLLAESSQYLNDSGILIVEVGNTQDAVIEAFPELPFTWLEFTRGGEGVFLLTKDQLPG